MPTDKYMDVLEKYPIGRGFESVQDREKDLPNPKLRLRYLH